MSGDGTENWHLDKRVPVALIITLLSQTFLFGWFLSNHESRIVSLEQKSQGIETIMSGMSNKMESVTKDSVETKVHLQYLSSSLKEIENILKKGSHQ